MLDWAKKHSTHSAPCRVYICFLVQTCKGGITAYYGVFVGLVRGGGTLVPYYLINLYGDMGKVMTAELLARISLLTSY